MAGGAGRERGELGTAVGSSPLTQCGRLIPDPMKGTKRPAS